MVSRFCKLELDYQIMAFVKSLEVFYEMCFCTKYLQCFILNTLVCTIMSGSCKTGHI